VAYHLTVKSVDVIPLRIPFSDGGGTGDPMPHKWSHLDIALIRIETAEGMVGWGEAFAYSCLATTTAAVREMVAPLVVGRAVTDLGALNRELQRKLHIQGRYGITIFAISGIDIALWDLAAKAENKSLAELLGGRRRDSVPAYASLVRYASPRLVANMASKAVAEGYRDVKLNEITREAIRAGREAVGPSIRLTVDVNCGWSVTDARAIMPELKRLHLFWVEEPIFPPEDRDTLKRLTIFGVPLAAGENACTVVQFSRLIPAVSYPQPSVTKVGGVTEFLKVAEVAKSSHKMLMPHSPYFGPGYWATLQLAAHLETIGLFEFLYVFAERWLSPEMPLPKSGLVRIPNAPGLGFEPDWDVISRYRVA
jgi:L-alanine-DL-glutamate epimerase-like enolase superfamily enzyme